MRRDAIFFISILLALSFILPFFAAADEVIESLASRILESFDPETASSEWTVVGSKFVTEGFPRVAYAKAWPTGLHGANREGADYQSLGIKARFDRQGFNYLEIVPVKENENGEKVPTPIDIPGRVKSLDTWVWGSQYNFYVQVQLQDYTGITWTLDLGDINYTGWRNLRVEIPSYIPQSEQYIPHLKNLKLVKLILWTRPTERVADFYVYFDNIKVVSDIYESRFDGDDLTWPEKIEETWSSTE